MFPTQTTDFLLYGLGEFGWLILIIISGFTLYTKYVQWKKRTIEEVAFTMVGVSFGIVGMVSAVSMFANNQYSTVITRAILMINSLRLILRPIRNVKWSIFVAVVGGVSVSYATVSMFGVPIQEAFAIFDLYLDPLMIGVGIFLLTAIPIYFALQFFEAIIGLAGNVLDHGLVAFPTGVMGIIEGLCLPYTNIIWGIPLSLPYAIFHLLSGG